jgi:hypothetical protein
MRGVRTLVGGDKRETGRGHRPLLRACHRDVDTPRIHLERHAAERRHAIHHQQRSRRTAARASSYRPAPSIGKMGSDDPTHIHGCAGWI